jgi:hypothetical protein
VSNDLSQKVERRRTVSATRYNRNQNERSRAAEARMPSIRLQKILNENNN